MKSKLTAFVFLMISSSLAIAATPLSSPLGSAVRSSLMNRDILIRQSLVGAMTAAVDKVQHLQKQGDEVSLTVGQDRLACTPDRCSLQWDTESEHAPKDSAEFQSTLYAVLSNWSDIQGPYDEAMQVVKFKQTGSTRINLNEGLGSEDQISCLKIPKVLTECSMVVSDMVDGTDSAQEEAYDKLKTTTLTLIAEQREALLNSVKGDAFLPPGDHSFGNGFFEIQHTLYSHMLLDGVTATAYYGYKTPLKNAAGQVVSNGIAITFTGSIDANGVWHLQQASAKSYLLAHHT